MEVNGEFESPLQRLAYVNNEAADNGSGYSGTSANLTNQLYWCRSY